MDRDPIGLDIGLGDGSQSWRLRDDPLGASASRTAGLSARIELDTPGHRPRTA
jgi:hypothetical protein